MYGSNAERSKAAKDRTAEAGAAEKAVSSNDPESYQRAASAHHSAVWANESAGNQTQAEKHRKAAKQFQDKADQHYRAKSFAESEGRAADQASKDAGLRAFGEGKDDDRSEQDLHKAASEAHDRAGKAAELAKLPREAKYHATRSAEHAAKAAPEES